MIIKVFSWLLCYYVALTAAVDETFKLTFVQILYRHGDRAPIKLYPYDPNPVSAFPLGLGELTLLGRKEHFGLGKFFHNNYKDFKTSNPLEINVVSSDCNRCLDSAETNLASFYIPEGKWKFEDDTPWQPFPVRYVKKSEDKYLETESYCPRADEEKENLVKSPEGQAFIEKHKEMFDNLTINSGEDITEWTSASYLWDVLFIEKRYNLTVPKWIDPWWNELTEVADLSFKWKFNTPVLHRLRAGPLLQRIIEKFQEKINGYIPDLKFQVYSAVNVTSSDDARCLQSAEANMASFYAPQKPWKFDENFDWQPISIRYLPKKIDKYLQTESDCPRATAEELRVANTPEAHAFNSKHQDMYNYLGNKSGKLITGWKPAAYLRDNLWIEMRYNLSVPDWAEPYWNELTHVKDYAFYWIFNSLLLLRLRAGPLLQNMIETIEDKIKGKIPNLKFQIFSAHDTNIVALLMSLNLFDMKQPPYCATLLVELYSGKNDTHFVRLLYLNTTEFETTQTPHILKLDGCTEFCPLPYFTEYTKHLIPDDWDKECQLPDSNLQKLETEEFRLGMVVLGVAFILVSVSFAAVVFRMYSTSQKKKAFLVSRPNL